MGGLLISGFVFNFGRLPVPPMVSGWFSPGSLAQSSAVPGFRGG